MIKKKKKQLAVESRESIQKLECPTSSNLLITGTLAFINLHDYSKYDLSNHSIIISNIGKYFGLENTTMIKQIPSQTLENGELLR